MRKTLQVFFHEWVRVVFRKSFLLMLFLTPLFTYGLTSILFGSADTSTDNPVNRLLLPAPPKLVVEGFVDQSGVIRKVPASMEGRLLAFVDEISAADAIKSGEISAFYIIPPDYLKTGKLTYVRPDFNPMSRFTQLDAIQYTLDANLLSGGPVVGRFENPTEGMTIRILSEKIQRNPDDILNLVFPMMIAMVIYFEVFGAASLMLNSLTDEMQNRMIEVLMISVTPLQMLTGKVVALGMVGLLQTLVWAGVGYLLYGGRFSLFRLPALYPLPANLLVWGVVFFLLGYSLYAVLMAGAGVLIPRVHENSQIASLLMIPIAVPVFLIGALAGSPNGWLSVGLSLFPLTAPVAMMARLAASSSIPGWQPGAAALLLMASIILAVRLVAGLFIAQNLLAERAQSPKKLWKSLYTRG
jgi:ABC-2 type transport system permease protein